MGKYKVVFVADYPVGTILVIFEDERRYLIQPSNLFQEPKKSKIINVPLERILKVSLPSDCQFDHVAMVYILERLASVGDNLEDMLKKMAD